MTTFALLVLVMLALEGGLVALRRRPRPAPAWLPNFRYNALRPSDPADSYTGIDRDAARVNAEILAMSHRAPHN
ncbi:hypothetical protein OG921_05410 [Aldersonia sp. NBC_00410]|uniref:hypothetical protein n=1 Tax=Aldersonia sp. NBC_00410 TaxID=2975954 RepID=UPI00225BDD42|nr:hypothetical protein [Aldersonia sp. NBC_00410]MCX5042607.1 hypothetical protein [Aldersonia sp. NBC_00410]